MNENIKNILGFIVVVVLFFTLIIGYVSDFKNLMKNRKEKNKR